MLLFPSSKQIRLSPGVVVNVGRQDFSGPEYMFVSRSHCSLELASQDPLQVKVTATSKINPTLVQQGGQQSMLSEGQSTLLSEGDSFSVLLTKPNEAVKIMCVKPVDSVAAGQSDQPASDTAPKPSIMQGPSETTHSSMPLMLLLVGIPGSGKSTFAKRLVDSSPIQWVAVNQDSINRGKPGKRPECLKAAEAALISGSNCIIDRTNFDPTQRQEFINLARKLNRPAHCVFFDLPTAVCVERVTNRTGHPGGVQGKDSATVVYRFNTVMKKSDPPSLQEGFVSVTECTCDADYNEMLVAWLSNQVPVGMKKGSEKPASPPRGASSPGQPSSNTKTRTARAGSASSGGVSGASGGKKQTNLLSFFGATGQKQTPTSPPPLTSTTPSPSPLEHTKQLQGDLVPKEMALFSPKEKGGTLPTENVDDFAQANEIIAPQANAFSALMVGARRDAKRTAQQATGGKGSTAQQAKGGKESTAQQASVNEDTDGGGRKIPRLNFNSPWAQALRDMALNPHKYDPVHADDDVIMIPDKFAKARVHMLVIARDPKLNSIFDLQASHVPLLEHMHKVAMDWIGKQTQVPQSHFMLGFHSIPSMRQLHMHVISNDLDSPALKNKKHWNSFATEFFKPWEQVLHEVREFGAVQVDVEHSERLLASNLCCHKCKAPAKNMPALKAHISSCQV